MTDLKIQLIGKGEDFYEEAKEELVIKLNNICDLLGSPQDDNEATMILNSLQFALCSYVMDYSPNPKEYMGHICDVLNSNINAMKDYYNEKPSEV